ncbi:hypothetical protein B566_EDAN015856 [Ephemera danica]|nr:hypothetical protein B566_EDAN015856 [Ephemera danica]
MDQKVTIAVLCFFAVSLGSEQDLKSAVERLAARLDSHNSTDIMLPTVGVDLLALIRIITQNELKEQTKKLRLERQNTFTTGQQFPSSQLDLVELGGKKYFFSKKQLLSWIDAVSFCRLFGMELASVETREEDELLIKHLFSIEDDQITRSPLTVDELSPVNVLDMEAIIDTDVEFGELLSDSVVAVGELDSVLLVGMVVALSTSKGVVFDVAAIELGVDEDVLEEDSLQDGPSQQEIMEMIGRLVVVRVFLRNTNAPIVVNEPN